MITYSKRNSVLKEAKQNALSLSLRDDRYRIFGNIAQLHRQ